MTLRALVVDDEPPARRRLLRLLEAHPEVLVMGEADSGPEAVRQIREVEPDLLLLDIQLPEFDGFEVLNQVAAPPAVIFTTGYDQYALRAFEAAGIDYLLKPVEPETLERALGRLRRLAPAAARAGLEERVLELLKSWTSRPTLGRYQQRMAVPVGERALLVDLDDVTHFDAQDKYVFLHTASGKDYIVDHTLAELEQRLDPQRFVRVHRSTIVNLDRVKEIQKWFGGKQRLVLDDGKGSEIVVSKAMAPNLRSLVPF